ncbi:MAG: UvrD-helicase domain-containing protein [Bdellovibrionales bacterium]|nr:UvrD-helicase domain-containing protein [Bdellovibrionales bacterium]
MQSPSLELKNSVVRAGAGAGKTRGLVEKVVEVYRHFQMRGEVPRIVLTTFTRKATQELKERLILKACAERDPGLLQFVSDPARLHISTIHGLLNVFLRQVGHLAGLDAGFQIVSESEGEHLARLALRETVIASSNGLRWLDTYGFDRVLKMCQRYEEARHEYGGLEPATLDALMQASHVEAEKWKLWLGELAIEIADGVSEESWQVYARALESFVTTWAGDGADLEALPSKPRRSKKQAEFEAWHDRVDEAIKEFKKEMGRPCWNRELWPAMVATWAEFAQLGDDFVSHMDKLKEGQARYQMSDLEFKAIEILRSKPFLGTVFAESWDFWMIDEYQDTSPLQVEALSALIGDRPKYVVGDPQQSIYLFRGAEVRVFDEAEKSVRDSGGEVRQLRRNYRSSPDLLLWINDFMESLSSAFSSMEPREETAGEARVCATLVRASDGESELRAVASRIGALLAGGARLEQICVLGRTHRNLMDVSRALKEYGYPTHVHSSRGFSTRREVVDAQALWKFLINPHDNVNLMILLRSPWFFVEDYCLAELMNDKPVSLWRRLDALAEDIPESVTRLKQARVALDRAGLVHAFEETLCSAAFLDLSLVNDPAGRKESNLWKLISKARTLEKEGGVSALDFLESSSTTDPLDAAEGDATSAQEPNCINLMTIHGSKGLEFEHVILPRMGDMPRTSVTAPLEASDGAFYFPIWNEAQGEFIASPLDYLSARRQARRELEEFDRWLYVALTRAKHTLTLTWSERSRESWAERSPWFSLPAGRHEKERYAYEIVEEWPDPEPYLGAARAAPAVRPLWRESSQAGDERQSVTDLIAKPEAPSLQPRTKELLSRWEAQSAGTRLHRRLEALRYRAEDIPEDDEALNYVLGLETPPMSELVRSGQTEWGFQVQTFTGVIEGQIDLWGKHDGTIYIVDYKSGSPKRKEDAFTQLSIYAWALRRFGHTEPMQMVVIYPLAKNAEVRPFSEELFLRWENEFSGA